MKVSNNFSFFNYKKRQKFNWLVFVSINRINRKVQNHCKLSK